MTAPTCTVESHERLKRPSQWSQLPKLKPWVLSEEEGGPMKLELANCPACMSTIAVDVTVAGAK